MDTPSQGEGAVASEPEVKADPWEAAEEAFEAAPGEAKEVKEEVKAPDSQVAVEPEYLKLDDLRVPTKYKEAVKERLQKVVSDIEAKQAAAVEAASQELGQHKEVVKGLVDVFRDLTQTPRDQLPAKFAGYIDQYGAHLGVDPSVAQGFRAQQQQVQQQEARVAETVEALVDQMVVAEDSKIFREKLLGTFGLVEQNMMNKMGLLFRAYHEQYVAPDKKTLQDYKTKAEQEAEHQEFSSRKSSWDGAITALKGKYSDFEKYKPTMSKIIKEQKALSAARDALNGDSGDVESRQSFLENIYLAVSRKDALESAKRPSQGGLPPSRHINTKKPGGSWDSAWENTKDLWE